MTNFAYVFVWNGDVYIGLPRPDEKSELNIEAPEGLNVEIGETIVENGRAIVPVILHNNEGEGAKHAIKFEFVG